MCFQRPRQKLDCPSMDLEIQLIDTSRELPCDFAMKLIEREISLEKSCNKVCIEELINLYSLAIEHYSIKGDEKVKDYQSRMQRMLRRPDVLKVFSYNLNSQSNPNKLSPKTINNHEKTIESQPEPQEDPLNIEETVSLPEFVFTEEEIKFHTKEAENVVQDKEISDKVLGDKLLDSVKSQENDLATRLKKRKISRPVSMSPVIYSPVNEIESPKSVNSETKQITGEILSEDFELKIQEVMEKHYKEKAEKVAEVTVRYNSEISAMEDSGMMGMVVAQMKINMKQEIDDIGKDYDEKRKNEVKKLREEYLAHRGKSLS
ncbi:hypothetical protein SteCoe_33243 [Stentor coeruleus]|uniref:Uncharacterized protein n=1 Tax=Stentor coeruleus TaxID=5963 RepID=A0A1R2AX65_9CILI|nr:hypothetical protein SteCoe_33243 [Stentor coeruleus]